MLCTNGRFQRYRSGALPLDDPDCQIHGAAFDAKQSILTAVLVKPRSRCFPLDSSLSSYTFPLIDLSWIVRNGSQAVISTHKAALLARFSPINRTPNLK